jgi:PAS domain S-box-containing protein
VLLGRPYILERMERNEVLEVNRYNENTFKSLLAHSDDGVLILSPEGNALYISPSVNKILGYTEEEILSMNMLTLMHPDDIAPLGKVMELVLASPGLPIKGHTGQMRHKNGTWRWIEATVTNLLDDPDVRGIVDNFRDITEHKLADEKLQHVNRLYACTSQINQAIVRCQTEQALFKDTCRIAVEYGKFSAAWVGVLDVSNAIIDLAAHAGIPEEHINVFKNRPYTNSPQDLVVKTGSYFVANEVAADAPQNEWEAFASKRGFGSFIILPIRRAGEIVTSIHIYSAEKGFFKEQEIALLTEISNDISYALDIFERDRQRVLIEKALKESQWNMTGIIENTDARIYSLDNELRYITFNSSLKLRMKEMYGLDIKPGDVVYDFFEKIEHEEAMEWQQTYSKALSGEIVKFEKDFNVDDNYNSTSFSIHPIFSGNEVVGLSCFATDITKQKQESFHKEQLLHHIKERNKKLEQFSYVVSHNLRSPLATIIGLTDLLTTDEHKEDNMVLVEGIATSVKKLDEVIHDLNQILNVNSPINENKIKVHFSEILGDIQLSIGPLLNDEEVEIINNFTAADEMITLKSYLYSIFFNLISNSIKYKRPGIKPVIEISSVKDENVLKLVFKDNGLGIDLSQNNDKLFGLYNRFHTHTEGKGVGLYMVKEQVDALDGIITVQSEVGQGTTFEIEFELP